MDYRYNPYNPIPEGVEPQRLEPQVERLVITSEKLGRLDVTVNSLRERCDRLESRATNAERDAERYQTQLERWKNDYYDLEASLVELEKKYQNLLKKTSPKKIVKKTVKGKK